MWNPAVEQFVRDGLRCLVESGGDGGQLTEGDSTTEARWASGSQHHVLYQDNMQRLIFIQAEDSLENGWEASTLSPDWQVPVRG